ncbi:hypothetical protein DICVIV_08444 [Dictyocaulus viviparus]|uniref:Uncharacterized protein n=1 Tax=Dictyocaulus viviparus TaxID=29172 RepID=A0A0D8XSY9_DICVI|nr:hypothetical protein DICVIV_08444 [Dictyocaulus viviparus]
MYALYRHAAVDLHIHQAVTPIHEIISGISGVALLRQERLRPSAAPHHPVCPRWRTLGSLTALYQGIISKKDSIRIEFCSSDGMSLFASQFT